MIYSNNIYVRQTTDNLNELSHSSHARGRTKTHMVYLYGLGAHHMFKSVMRVCDLMNVMFEFCYFWCVYFGQCGKSGNSI